MNQIAQDLSICFVLVLTKSPQKIPHWYGRRILIEEDNQRSFCLIPDRALKLGAQEISPANKALLIFQSRPL